MGFFARLFAIVALAFACLGTVTSTAQAETMNWSIRSDHPNTVNVEFYSQKYNRSWPGNGRVYILDDYSTKRFVLACEYGEQICYGAWVRGNTNSYWGVGYGGRNRCKSCCGRCGYGDLPTFTLNR